LFRPGRFCNIEAIVPGSGSAPRNSSYIYFYGRLFSPWRTLIASGTPLLQTFSQYARLARKGGAPFCPGRPRFCRRPWPRPRQAGTAERTASRTTPKKGGSRSRASRARRSSRAGRRTVIDALLLIAGRGARAWGHILSGPSLVWPHRDSTRARSLSDPWKVSVGNPAAWTGKSVAGTQGQGLETSDHLKSAPGLLKKTSA